MNSSDRAIIRAALQVLIEHLEPLKLARFVAVCDLGEGDYLKTKDTLFANETVDSLYEKIQKFEAAQHE
jgi:hypothetical protein